MNEQRLRNLNVGDRIRHTTFREGLVTKCELGIGDVVVTIAFDENHGIKRFLLSSAPLIMIEENKDPPKIIKAPKSPPKIIKNHKSPNTYTTEFKIKIVKQALARGRTEVRKHYKIPETTLRNWIKLFK
jgi:hypothetical protein